jgi:hypothetical protein
MNDQSLISIEAMIIVNNYGKSLCPRDAIACMY